MRNSLLNLLLRLCLVTLLSAALASPFAFSEEKNFWPSLRTDHEKTEFLLWVRKNMVPNLFQAITEYNVDLYETLGRQQRINDELARQPHLAPLLESRPDRMAVDLRVLPAGSANAAQDRPELDSAALEAYGARMREALAQLPEGSRNLKGLREELERTLKIHSATNEKNLLSRLVNCLPEERRKAVFLLDPDQKLEVFQKELTQGQIEANIPPKDRKRMGFNTLQDAERVVGELRAREAKLNTLFGAAAIAVHRQGEAHDDQAPLHLDHLGPRDALVLGNRDQLTSALQELLPPKAAKQGAEALSEQTRTFGAAVREIKPLASHTLVQVPANLAWTAGCVGGDCFTKNMNAYVNAPTLRKWYMDPGPEGPRGYFQTELVESHGKRYLLFKIVQGKQLNGDMVEYAVRALSQHAKELGADGVMLPTSELLSWLTNYNVIRDRLRSFVQGRPEAHYAYLDYPLREALHPFVNNSQYYQQSHSNLGVVVPFDQPNPGFEVHSELKAAPEFRYEDPKVSRGEALLTAFEMDEAAQKPEMAERFLRSLDIPDAEYGKLKPILGNQEHLPMDQYFARVAATLKAEGYDFDPATRKNGLSALTPGLLRAPNAWSEKWRGKSMNASLSLLQRQNTAGLIAESTTSGLAHGFDLSQEPRLRQALLDQLGDNYTQRRAAGGMLLFFGQDYDKALPPLFGLAHESFGLDENLNRIFFEGARRNPGAFKEALIQGLHSPHDWVQRGALNSLWKTGMNDAEIQAAVASLQHGGARSHDAYLDSLKVSEHLASGKCTVESLVQALQH